VHTPSQCLGGEYCDVGYTGILCEECDYDKGYARDTPFTCGKCENSSRIWFVSAVTVMFIVAVILVLVYGNISFRNEELRN
jgi:hypothetical protein